MNDTFFPVYNAEVQREDLVVFFYRLHKDTRDIMSDCVKPEWTAVDEFIIKIQKMDKVSFWRTPKFSRPDAEPIKVTKIKKVDEFEICTKSKKVANYVWFLAAKAGVTYETLKEMKNTRKFA